MWAKVDDRFYDHPKTVALLDTPAALGLWVLALSWVGRHLTDGWVPRAQVHRLLGVNPAEADRLAARLVEAQLWDAREDGFVIHNYLEFNPSRAQVERQRAMTRQRQARFTERRWPAPDAVTNAVSDAVTNAVPNDAPDPTRITPLTPLRQERRQERREPDEAAWQRELEQHDRRYPDIAIPRD
jgi:hypothetical protein